MEIFELYARYYDLLYKEKDYCAEASKIHQSLLRFGIKPSRIIELGCGTGRHAVELAAQGWFVDGIDLSSDMVERANERARHLRPDLASRLKFRVGDARTAESGEPVQAVISLFHVVSYHVTNKDLKDLFASVSRHLLPGGVFIFDIWYGPAVLSKKPEVRVKYISNESTTVTRIAHPTLFPNDNLVDVHYRIIVKDCTSNQSGEFEETHRMRYMFAPEIRLLAEQAGLTVVDTFELNSGQAPGTDTWSVCFIVRK
jgi:SAM-dependent methyltransferase